MVLTKPNLGFGSVKNKKIDQKNIYIPSKLWVHIENVVRYNVLLQVKNRQMYSFTYQLAQNIACRQIYIDITSTLELD